MIDESMSVNVALQKIAEAINRVADALFKIQEDGPTIGVQHLTDNGPDFGVTVNMDGNEPLPVMMSGILDVNP